MNTTDALNPVIRVPNIQGASVDVKELRWRDYLRAIKELTTSILALLAEPKPAGKGQEPESEEGFSFDLGGGKVMKVGKERLLQAIATNEELVLWVLQASTGKDAQWVEACSGREVLALLAAVVELNLSREVVGSGKALADHMRGVFGSKK